MSFLPGLTNLFTGGKNPADKAMPYLDKAAGQFQPYQQQGQQAYNQLQPQYSTMASDPAAFLEKLMQSYQPSQSYGLRRDEMMKAAGNTAAAGGMRGSINDINNETSIVDSLLGDDMQSWLNNVLGLQNTGLAGEQGFYNKGFDASTDLANVFNTQGSLAFQGQANKNQSQADFMKALLGAGTAIASTPQVAGKIASWL